MTEWIEFKVNERMAAMLGAVALGVPLQKPLVIITIILRLTVHSSNENQPIRSLQLNQTISDTSSTSQNRHMKY